MSMLKAMVAAVFALSVCGSAQAQDEFADDEVVVWGDLFARWDETRWWVETEMRLPYGMWLAKDENLEFLSSAIHIRTIIKCSKEWRLTKRRYEVDCELEDFGMQAAVRDDEAMRALKATRRMEARGTVGSKLTSLEKAKLVMDEIDAKLTGAKLQLQVADDGRVVRMDLEGVPKNNNRQQRIHETLRQILSRVTVGFDLKLRKYNQLNEGKWVEYNTALMSMPLPAEVSGSNGSSMVVHYLNKYKGQVLVQSVGKGMVQLPAVGDRMAPQSYVTDLVGVSIFDRDEGYMTERVWALDGQISASTMFGGSNYFHAGKITMLGEDDHPVCGTTEIVAKPDTHIEGLKDWEPMQDVSK